MQACVAVELIRRKIYHCVRLYRQTRDVRWLLAANRLAFGASLVVTTFEDSSSELGGFESSDHFWLESERRIRRCPDGAAQNFLGVASDLGGVW